MGEVNRPGREGKNIASVLRALRILELFNDQTAELGITEMARQLHLHKSTVSGLVYTLQDNGYLDQNTASRKYRLGTKLIERAFVALGHLEVTRVALPYMESLHRWRDETVNLAILDRDEVVYVERVLSSQTLGVRSEVGKRAMAHSTALGKALLAYLPAEELERFLSCQELTPVTPNTITDPQTMRAELHLTRSRGYAIDVEENELGGICVAAPIIDHRGKSVAAISMSIPSVRLPEDEIPAIAERVVQAARGISQDLGFNP